MDEDFKTELRNIILYDKPEIGRYYKISFLKFNRNENDTAIGIIQGVKIYAEERSIFRIESDEMMIKYRTRILEDSPVERNRDDIETSKTGVSIYCEYIIAGEYKYIIFSDGTSWYVPFFIRLRKPGVSYPIKIQYINSVLHIPDVIIRADDNYDEIIKSKKSKKFGKKEFVLGEFSTFIDGDRESANMYDKNDNYIIAGIIFNNPIEYKFTKEWVSRNPMNIPKTNKRSELKLNKIRDYNELIWIVSEDLSKKDVDNIEVLNKKIDFGKLIKYTKVYDNFISNISNVSINTSIINDEILWLNKKDLVITDEVKRSLKIDELLDGNIIDLYLLYLYTEIPQALKYEYGIIFSRYLIANNNTGFFHENAIGDLVRKDELIKLLKTKKKILIPVNYDGGVGHWILLHIRINTESVLVDIYDTSSEFIPRELLYKRIKKLLINLDLSLKLSIDEIKIPQQEDNVACGPNILVLAESLLQKRDWQRLLSVNLMKSYDVNDMLNSKRLAGIYVVWKLSKLFNKTGGGRKYINRIFKKIYNK